MKQERRERTITSSIQVAANKLGTFVDLVGELVTVQASLSQKALSSKDAKLISTSEEVERLTTELRDNTQEDRMNTNGQHIMNVRDEIVPLNKPLENSTYSLRSGEEIWLLHTFSETFRHWT